MAHRTTPSRTAPPDDARRVIILGSTGSIGRQTLDVIESLNREHANGRCPRAFRVVGLAAGSNASLLFQQAAAFGVRDVALADGDGATTPPGLRVHRGRDAGEALVRSVEADVVLGAMVGAAGLPATLAAVELGRDVALANKETLVAAGELVVPAARRTGARLLPVDSEHSAVWQCLPAPLCPPCAAGPEIRRVILTASGGPFRTWSLHDMQRATPEQALAHPTWTMGAKVTIDSASMTNKALEIIEAHWLFGLDAPRIDVLVHPQSIVHSFVEYVDGSTLAQLGAPDMRTPIQFALTWPDRPPGCSPAIDWTKLPKLDFEKPDLEKFPALRLAYEVIELGGVAGAVMNAANERAVQAFLDRRIAFGAITDLTERAVRSLVGSRPQGRLSGLGQALEADDEARGWVDAALDEVGAVGAARLGR